MTFFVGELCGKTSHDGRLTTEPGDFHRRLPPPTVKRTRYRLASVQSRIRTRTRIDYQR
jgi:hypothetical protein